MTQSHRIVYMCVCGWCNYFRMHRDFKQNGIISLLFDGESSFPGNPQISAQHIDQCIHSMCVCIVDVLMRQNRKVGKNTSFVYLSYVSVVYRIYLKIKFSSKFLIFISKALTTIYSQHNSTCIGNNLVLNSDLFTHR